jgi:hypothetical protein
MIPAPRHLLDPTSSNFTDYRESKGRMPERVNLG